MGILDFEQFQLKDWWNQIKENKGDSALQFILGAADPFSAKVWGKVLGKDFEPFVNQFGGPTDERFARADEAGVDTGFARDSHAIVQSIVGAYGANALGGAAGIGGGEGAGSLGLNDWMNIGGQAQNLGQGGGIGSALTGQAPSAQANPTEQQHLAVLLQEALRLEEERRRAAALEAERRATVQQPTGSIFG